MREVKSAEQKREFARKLARFHLSKNSEMFGFHHDNYLNAYLQNNSTRYELRRRQLKSV
jgi:fructosamine-3-kinase